jgi:hypothetical protein
MLKLHNLYRNKKCLPNFTSRSEFMQLGVSRVGVYFATPVALAQIKSYRLLAPAAVAYSDRPIFIGGCVALLD